MDPAAFVFFQTLAMGKKTHKDFFLSEFCKDIILYYIYILGFSQNIDVRKYLMRYWESIPFERV